MTQPTVIRTEWTQFYPAKEPAILEALFLVLPVATDAGRQRALNPLNSLRQSLPFSFLQHMTFC